MIKINLRDYYPFYNADFFIDLQPDEVVDVLREAERQEEAYKRSVYRHKAQYSLDRGDGIEYDILFVSHSLSEIYERKVTYEQLHAAMASLPDKQAKRIYAHYFLGISNVAIAKAEGVSEKAIRITIEKGLRHLKNILKNIL